VVDKSLPLSKALSFHFTIIPSVKTKGGWEKPVLSAGGLPGGRCDFMINLPDPPSKGKKGRGS
jgi:hypothetical protein